MEATNSPQTTRSTTGRKILRILLKSVLIIVLLISAIVLSILTPPVQNFIRKKAQTYLSGKLNTRVEIGRIYIGFPKKIVLENVYVEDLQKDTLLSGGSLKVDVSMMKLLQNELEINQVDLTSITAKIRRQMPDTLYNFQFIIDAFAPKKEPTEKVAPDSASMKISVKKVTLDKIRLVYDDVVTGNDMTVWLEHFDTEIETFDMEHLNFDVPVTHLRGVNARIVQRTPLVESNEVDSSVQATRPFLFNFDKIQLADIAIDYGNEPSAFFLQMNLGKLLVNAEDVDMQNQMISLTDFQLDNTNASIRLGKKQAAKEVAEKVSEKVEEVVIESKSAWRVYAKNIWRSWGRPGE